MVPDCVPWVMNELKVLSLELQSMPKNPKVRFGYLEDNPYRSVCTISSHDMPTLRQWWDEDDERTQAYYSTMLHRSGGAPHPLPGWLARDIVSRHLCSPSMLCVLSIQTGCPSMNGCVWTTPMPSESTFRPTPSTIGATACT